jgi:ElaB/YqjD/DUF883 family membrane-anchored ribosome-binding protein
VSVTNHSVQQAKKDEGESEGGGTTVEYARKIASSVAATVASGKERAVDALESARQVGSRAVDTAARQVKHSPLRSVAAVFVVGVIVGFAMNTLARRR